MSKPLFNVIKNEAAREATIYIYGRIGGLDMESWKPINTADKFKDEFKAIEADADTIHVRINSPGGSVFEGLAIYNTLFASSKKIITYNDGLAASMGALILLAGDEIHSFSNSLFMLHNASGMFAGNKKQIEEQLEVMDSIDESLSTAIEERLGITSEEVKENYLNYKDNWFTAKQAEAAGFYDLIIKKKKALVPEDAINMNAGQLFDKYAAMSFSIPTQESKPENTMSKPISYPNLEAALGLSEPLASTTDGSFLNEDQKQVIEDQLTASAANVQAANDAKATAEADLAAEKATAKTALEAATAGSDEVLGQLKAVATVAGVENIAENATSEEIQTAITAKIQELNGKPGASHTAGAADDAPAAEHAYIDFNSSIYNTK